MIEKIIFDGLKAVEIKTSRVKIIVVYEIGPRIAFLQYKNNENILFWNKELEGRGEWKIYGGHRVWVTRPMADESEDTYRPDNKMCNLEIHNRSVRIIAPKDEITELEKGIEIEIIDENTFKVTNFVKNVGDLIYSCGVWSPTCVNPNGKKIIIPLGEKNSTWDIVKVVTPLKFAGNEISMQDEQIKYKNNDLVLYPQNKVTKRVALAKQGKVQLDCGKYIFEKCSPYNSNYRYPFEGCNVAIFNGKDNWMAELETFGNEVSLAPNQTNVNVEFWKIYNK